MGYLHFCCDGILRRTMSVWNPKEGERTTRKVPLQAVEQAVDPDVFLKSLHDAVDLEDGLTIGQFFENLAPWANLMTGVACMDFPAFLEEVRKTPKERLDDCSHIEVLWRASISAVPEFERPKDAGKRGILDFGAPVKTGRLTIQEGWDMDAILTPEGRKEYDGAHAVSLSFTPLSEWAHLPLRICESAALRDETACPINSVYLGTDLSLTRPEHQNIEVVTGSNDRVFAHDIKIDPPTPTFFDTIVRGLLWEIGFHYSPCGREHVEEKVMASVNELNDPDSTAKEPDVEVDEDDLEYRTEMKRLGEALMAAQKLGLPIQDGEEPQG